MDTYVDVFRYRELFGSLFRRDFRARYKGSILGVAWSLANPLILLGVYLLLFSVLLQVSNGIDHYPLYLLSGLAIWVFFATSLQQASRSMVDYSELIRKVRFPRQLVAFSTVATQLVAFAAMLGVLFVIDLIVLPRTRGVIWLAIPLAALIGASSRVSRSRLRRPTSSSATSSTSSRLRSSRGSSSRRCCGHSTSSTRTRR